MQTLLVHSDDAWTQAQTDEGNLLEAFDGHPQIGNVDSLKENTAILNPVLHMSNQALMMPKTV